MSEKLTAEQILLQSPIWLSGSQAKKQILSVMEKYAVQEARDVQDELDKSTQMLQDAYQLICRVNEHMSSVGTSIGNLTDLEVYHFVGNDGPVIEDFLNKKGLNIDSKEKER